MNTPSKELRSVGFEMEIRLIPIASITPLKVPPPYIRRSPKFRQISASMRAIGLVENIVVTPDHQRQGAYLLLDGLLRLEVAKTEGWTEIECLISKDDESYTYNRRINRLAPIQEHKMVVRAIARGVPADRIAEALNVEVSSVTRRVKLLDGVCNEAAAMLSDQNCPMIVFDHLRRMKPARQIEAAELMLGQRNFTTSFTKAILAATPSDQLAPGRTRKKGDITHEEIGRLERELISAQSRAKYVEDAYGEDNLQLTIAKTFLTKLLGKPHIASWLQATHPEYLAEFQEIAELDSIENASGVAQRHSATNANS